MKTFSNNSMKLDNIITVSDVQFMVDDNTATQIYELLIKHFTPVPVADNTVVSAPKTEEPKKAEPHSVYPNNVTCKWSVESIKTPEGKTFYRIKDGIFTAGKWRQSKFDANKEYRITTNQEAHAIALGKVKNLDNIEKVQMDGYIAYGFSKKATATKALEKLPEKIQGVEIHGYIAEHGAIPTKSYTRVKAV